MKFEEFLDLIIAFALGAAFTLTVNAAIYGIGAPRVIIVAAISAIIGLIGAAIAYCIGKRRVKTESLIAYNRGVERGRTLGRAEIISERQRFAEFDN